MLTMTVTWLSRMVAMHLQMLVAAILSGFRICWILVVVDAVGKPSVSFSSATCEVLDLH